MNNMRRCLISKENNVYKFGQSMLPFAYTGCSSSSSGSCINRHGIINCSYLLSVFRSYIKIRLQRTGRRNLPHYRIVVANTKSPRDGKFIEKVTLVFYRT